MSTLRFVSVSAVPRAAALGAALLLTPLPASAQLSDVQMEWGVTIPVRDGTELRGTIYRPADQTEPLPVILGIHSLHRGRVPREGAVLREAAATSSLPSTSAGAATRTACSSPSTTPTRTATM